MLTKIAANSIILRHRLELLKYFDMVAITLKKYIESFNKMLNDPDLSCESIKGRINKLIQQTPISFQQINLNFLVRTSVLEKGEICTNISRGSYNPDRDGIPLQRCNYKKQQVFYGTIPGGMKNFGDGAQTSFMETCFDKIKEDPTFTNRFILTTRWKFKYPPLVWVLPFHSGSIELNDNFKFLFTQFDSFLKRESKDESTYLDLKAKAEFLSGLYCTNENKKAAYRITATFHNELCKAFDLQMEEKLQGLIYPSANTKGEGMNIVLNKDFVIADNIFCDHAVLYYFQRHPDDPKDISFFPVAACDPDENGNLHFVALKK